MASCSNSRVAKEAKRESTTMGPNWLELPREVTANILQRLDTVDIVTSACLVCPLWWNICKDDPLMWRTIHMSSDMRNLRTSPYYLLEIFRYAVERSCGHLEDIDIEFFCNDNLLKFISDRGIRLRRMRLVRCWGISDKGLSNAVRKLPLLVELDISHCRLSKDTFEVIGQWCPFLKSLKTSWMFNVFGRDDEAFAIAKTMSGLRHLKITGVGLSRVALIAILDGCPLLESLDLQDCYDVGLSGSLEKRCREQITDLRLPNQYVDDSFDDDGLAYMATFEDTNANDDWEY